MNQRRRPDGIDPVARREHDLDRLADAVEQHMDLARLAECVPYFGK